MTEKLVYSPIILEFVEAVLSEEGKSYIHPNYQTRMEIISPFSKNMNTVQSLGGRKTKINIPSTGVVKLLLLPSNTYSPNGSYIVKYYHGKSSTAYETQSWTVPSPPPVRTEYLSGYNPSKTLSYPAYNVVSVSHPGEFNLVNNSIVWLTNPPEENQGYSVTYQPAITLDQLLDCNLTYTRNNTLL